MTSRCLFFALVTLFLLLGSIPERVEANPTRRGWWLVADRCHAVNATNQDKQGNATVRDLSRKPEVYRCAKVRSGLACQDARTGTASLVEVRNDTSKQLLLVAEKRQGGSEVELAIVVNRERQTFALRKSVIVGDGLYASICAGTYYPSTRAAKKALAKIGVKP